MPIGRREPPDDRPTPPSHPGWYAAGILGPLLVGALFALSGALVLASTTHPTGARQAELAGGVTLLVLAALVYVIVGLWLVPASLAVGSIAFWAGFELLVHVPSLAVPIGAAGAVVGVLGVSRGLRARFGPVARGPA
jgi:hypothetical protein